MDVLFTLVIGLALGYYTVCRVPSVFHAPLMSLTNGVSSICILIVLEELVRVCVLPDPLSTTVVCLAIAVMLMLSLNIVGGFYITQRMIDFFYPKSAQGALPYVRLSPAVWIGGTALGLGVTGLAAWALR
jgi:NAD(P) transhydrogenase subunit alpha